MRENAPLLSKYPLQSTVEDYCNFIGARPDTDIEKITIRALAQVLFEPAGFGLEVISLDDCAETEIIHFCNAKSNLAGHGLDNVGAPVARLLFHP